MINALSEKEREVVKLAIQEAMNQLEWDLETRIGVSKDSLEYILHTWPNVDDTKDGSVECVAINNSLNDLLHGIGLSEEKIKESTGVGREELLDIYRKWAKARGWSSTGVM